MSNRNYVYPAKTLSQSRSKFKVPHTIKTSFYHGDCVPFQVFEVLPGDTFKLNIASLIRMSTPIAPIMDNITMHLAAYFVPNRLVYDNWEQVMGANKTGAWSADDNTYFVPTVGISTYDANGSPYTTIDRTIGTYMGVHLIGGGLSDIAVSALPGRAYALIWNEYYRNQNVTAPLAIDHTSGSHVLVDDVNFYGMAPQKLGKYSDYFTKMLPEPQKHDPIAIIPNDLAVGFYDADDSFTQIAMLDGSGLATDTTVAGDDNAAAQVGDEVVSETVNQAWNNINALRFAFQLQKFYEKDARYGTRYFEMLNGHFGVTNPDLVLNRPQFLGEINFRINIDQVLSTAGYSASSSTTVGAPGANSVTGNKGSLFTGSFTEHGYIIIVGGTRHDHTYGQGTSPLWFRKDRLDFYDPVFANIGEQPVESKFIFYSGGGPTSGNSIIGYQEAWAEYRFIPDRVSGILQPWYTGSLDFWTLADHFHSKPLLNDTFIYENRDSISRALVTGDTGPDYIADFYFDLTVTREMPLFSIPGLADHH